MKLHRSTKCSLKFLTAKKHQELGIVLAEYGKVVNQFINHFWNQPVQRNQLLKPIVDLPQTWLSARLRKVAAREALDMISATKERWKDQPNKMVKPTHKGNRMYVSCTIANLKHPTKAKQEFDLWLELRSIGNKIGIDIPIKRHDHFNNLQAQGNRLNSYIITKDYVQFVFEIETGAKKAGKTALGVDTGINALATLSTGEQLGRDIKGLIERTKRCQHGSKGQRRAKRALRQRMDEVAKEIAQKSDLIVVEALKKMGHNGKLKRRLSKNMRRSIGAWNWRYWLQRLQMDCEWNRVSFRTVAPQYTSQRCHACGHIDRGNRDGEKFCCLKCGHKDNADVNASRNILDRFLTGPYGAGYQPLSLHLSN
jgi:IS605 OrfB family transposase